MSRPRRTASLLLPLALFLSLVLSPGRGAASEIGPPLRLLTLGENNEELLLQAVAGYDSRSYDGSGAFGDVDTDTFEGEVRVILPSGDWEFEGRVGVWRMDVPISMGGMSGDVTDPYPMIGAGVRTLLWQDNAALGWRVGVAADVSVTLLDFNSGTVSGPSGETAKFTCDKPYEFRLALPVSRVVAPTPYVLGDFLGIATYTREYYGGPFLRMSRLPVKARVTDSFGDGSYHSEDLSGSSLPGLFGGVRWAQRVQEGERSFGFEGQYKDGFNLGFYGSLSF